MNLRDEFLRIRREHVSVWSPTKFEVEIGKIPQGIKESETWICESENHYFDQSLVRAEDCDVQLLVHYILELEYCLGPLAQRSEQ